MWVRAEVDKASAEGQMLQQKAKALCKNSPVSHSNFPILPGVPTAAPTFVRFKYCTCSSSLKCRANSFATSPPFSPRILLLLSARVMSVTRRAPPARKMSVGAPLSLDFCVSRILSVGATVLIALDHRRRCYMKESETFCNEVPKLVKRPGRRPCCCVYD